MNNFHESSIIVKQSLRWQVIGIRKYDSSIFRQTGFSKIRKKSEQIYMYLDKWTN